MINIKAGLDGQFEFPDNSQLVSCIYWLSCPHKFLKPVTLEIWHCALIQNQSQSSGLQFVVAKCSQPELPYKFKALDKGAFSAHSSYGSIQVSQFSLFGLISIFWSPRRYYSTLHYVRKGIRSWHVDIAVTWNHPAHLQVSFIPDACTYMKLSPQQTPLNLKLEGKIQRLASFTCLWSHFSPSGRHSCTFLHLGGTVASYPDSSPPLEPGYEARRYSCTFLPLEGTATPLCVQDSKQFSVWLGVEMGNFPSQG